MLLVDRWATLMAGLIGVIGREMFYINGRNDSCFWQTGGLS